MPEIDRDQVFRFIFPKVIDEFVEAKNAGIHTRPVLLGPVSYLLLSKASSPDGTPLGVLPGLISVYGKIFQRLATAGADWLQIDEPCLVMDLDDTARSAYINAYVQLSQIVGIHLMVATYFGSLGDNLALAANLPIAGLHIDLVCAPQQLEDVLS